jgi:hypothetical protein
MEATNIDNQSDLLLPVVDSRTELPPKQRRFKRSRCESIPVLLDHIRRINNPDAVQVPLSRTPNGVYYPQTVNESPLSSTKRPRYSLIRLPNHPKPFRVFVDPVDRTLLVFDDSKPVPACKWLDPVEPELFGASKPELRFCSRFRHYALSCHFPSRHARCQKHSEVSHLNGGLMLLLDHSKSLFLGFCKHL